MVGNSTVLFVDDEHGVREAVKFIFIEDDSIELLVAEDAASGLELLESHNVDVLVSDYQLGGTNGLELMEQARQSSPDTVRILISAKIGLEKVTDAFNSGLLSQFILKPWQEDEELVSAVQMAIRSRRVFLESRRLASQFQEVKEKVNLLEQAVMDTCAAIRYDSRAAADIKFLRDALGSAA